MRPDGDRVRLLVRAPLEAMQDIVFPTLGPGYLDVPRAARRSCAMPRNSGSLDNLDLTSAPSRELGLRCLFVECARGDLLINAAQARPTLEVAAKLGVPVFVHPVAPQPLTQTDGPLWAHRDSVRTRYGEFSRPYRPG